MAKDTIGVIHFRYMNEENEKLKSKYYVQRESKSTHPATCPCEQCKSFYRFEEDLLAKGILKEEDIRYGMIDARWSGASDTK